MIRISFNKIAFLSSINESHVVLEVSNQKGDFFKISPKRIKGNIAKIYGDFIEVKTNTFQLEIKVYVSEIDKRKRLIEKLLIEKFSYGFKQKKCHIIQKGTLKIIFDSQIIKQTDMDIEQNEEDFSNYAQKNMLPQRLMQMKQMRGFSPDQKRVLERFSLHFENKLSFKNASFAALQKPLKDKQVGVN